LQRRLTNLKLGAHFLDLRSLFFEMGYQNFHRFLLLWDGDFQVPTPLRPAERLGLTPA